MIENLRPVIHPPRSVLIHILPLYKSKLAKIEKKDIIGKVTGSTDLLNSIIYQISTINDGTSKIRLCMDPQESAQKHKKGTLPYQNLR